MSKVKDSNKKAKYTNKRRKKVKQKNDFKTKNYEKELK